MELTRGVDPVMLAAMAAPFYPVALVYLDWPGGAIRAHSGRGSIVFDGNTFAGVGWFAGIEIPGEGLTNAASGAVLHLVGAPADIYGFENDAIRNQTATIWAGVTTEPGGNVLVGDPCPVFMGYMDGLKFAETRVEADTGEVSVTIDCAVTLGTGPGARSRASITHSYEDQIAAYPGDTAGRSLINLVERMKAMTWPE